MYYIIVYTNNRSESIKFIWDENKNRLNKKKHSVDFDLAKHIFEDPQALSWLDVRFHNYNEVRWVTIGRVYDEIMVVVHTYKSEKYEQELIRIISARKASKKERKYYVDSSKKTFI